MPVENSLHEVWSEKAVVENKINCIASSEKIFSAGRPLINKPMNKKRINIWIKWIKKATKIITNTKVCIDR